MYINYHWRTQQDELMHVWHEPSAIDLNSLAPRQWKSNIRTNWIFCRSWKATSKEFFLGCNEEKLIFASWMPTKIVVACCHPPSSKQKSNRSMHYLNCNTSNLTPDACFPLRSHTPASRFTLVIDSQLNQTYLLPLSSHAPVPRLPGHTPFPSKSAGIILTELWDRTLIDFVPAACKGLSNRW